ncbi:hypothetical protein [Geminicoccus harenae]|uniref:hypothetical protein n=1 Tax=Geminicoccus harenae TaxID=2498453 RepID=UPI00168AEF20|nr:hypothetical protein [Geminicoccus harenae]
MKRSMPPPAGLPWRIDLPALEGDQDGHIRWDGRCWRGWDSCGCWIIEPPGRKRVAFRTRHDLPGGKVFERICSTFEEALTLIRRYVAFNALTLDRYASHDLGDAIVVLAISSKQDAIDPMQDVEHAQRVIFPAHPNAPMWLEAFIGRPVRWDDRDLRAALRTFLGDPTYEGGEDWRLTERRELVLPELHFHRTAPC